MSGYIFVVDGSAVSWSSKKQPIVALSTTEAEYIAWTHAAKEALWICMFIVEIAWPLQSPTILKCDNQSAICIAKNDQYHLHTKHIDIRFHFIWDAMQSGGIFLEYCPMEHNVANLFTKALLAPRLDHLVALMGLHAA